MTKPDPRAAFAAHVSTLAASIDTIDYYQLLGASREASFDEIKRAFHRVAGIYHPDVHPHADKQVQRCLTLIFKRMSEAYRILHDQGRRKRYDDKLAQRGHGRMVETKREQSGPKSPDAELRTTAGKRCFMQAIQQIKRKDYQGARLNLQLALNYEGRSSKPVLDKIAEVEELTQKR